MRVSFPFSRGRLIMPPVLMRHAFRARPDLALDTGARLTVITPDIAEQLGLEPDGTELSVSITGATGTASAALLKVASVSILGAEVKNLRVICHPLPTKLKVDGILGLNFLSHFDIEISNRTETVALTKWRE